MTEKQMNELANIVADKVVKQLEEKQKEWDNKFHYEIDNFVTDSTISVKHIEAKDLLQDALDYAKNNLENAIQAEDYMAAEKINKYIEDIQKKLLNL